MLIRKQSQLSTIEKSVTHLLIATKQLLETLTQWSRKNATETQVSDVYVRLGYEFNIACRAFQSINVDVSDLGNVPDALRQILEETLSQEASQKSLDIYLPKIRDIIINLLHGLKRKQAKLRAKAKEGQTLPRAVSGISIASTSTGNSSASEILESALSHNLTAMRPGSPTRRQQSQAEEPNIPARNSSTQYGRDIESVSQHTRASSREGFPYRQPSSRDESPSIAETTKVPRERKQPAPSVSSMSSNAMQNIPVISPPEIRATPEASFMDETPPPPPPKQSEALLALQRGGELERRASRRYSAYQIQKLVGMGPGGVPSLPPQNSPIPNRGRDVKESLNAVRTRTSLQLGRQRSQRLRGSPNRSGISVSRISEEYVPKEASGPSSMFDNGTSLRTDEDKSESTYIDTGRDESGARLSSPVSDDIPAVKIITTQQPTEPSISVNNTVRQDSIEQEQFIPEQSPQPGKELTLFLQYKSKIKKVVFADGSDDLSMARIQLAFIEKFQWNTHNHGVDLPDIYIQDQMSGVRHELEDLTDIKERSVLVLNVEPLEEVKQHFDTGVDGLRQLLEGIRSTMDGQQLAMNQVSSRQNTVAKEIARLASIPPTNPAESARISNSRVHGTGQSFQEINSLRIDLAAIRSSLTAFTAGVATSMASIREKALTVKAKSLEVEVPELDNENGPAYVAAGKDMLGQGTEALINNVDDLQDIVEDLRKDVVTRGVRPLPRQLEQVGKDISLAHKELLRIKEYVKKEKPIWTKVWTKQLDTVMSDREFMTLQEDFISDLQTDLDMAAETFSLVEQATKQQNADTAEGKSLSLRSTSRTLPVDAEVDPMKAKDSLLGEVRALRPNHETRLEAIERAERARQKELEDRRENVAFKKELGSFVFESKLRKTTGFEELERQIRAKEELALREEHQAVQTIKFARSKARAEERARQAQAQVAAMGRPDEAEDGGNDQYEDAREAEEEPSVLFSKESHASKVNGSVHAESPSV